MADAGQHGPRSLFLSFAAEDCEVGVLDATGTHGLRSLSLLSSRRYLGDIALKSSLCFGYPAHILSLLNSKRKSLEVVRLESSSQVSPTHLGNGRCLLGVHDVTVLYSNMADFNNCDLITQTRALADF